MNSVKSLDVKSNGVTRFFDNQNQKEKEKNKLRDTLKLVLKGKRRGTVFSDSSNLKGMPMKWVRSNSNKKVVRDG